MTARRVGYSIKKLRTYLNQFEPEFSILQWVRMLLPKIYKETLLALWVYTP